jgi:hypothetical protein
VRGTRGDLPKVRRVTVVDIVGIVQHLAVYHRFVSVAGVDAFRKLLVRLAIDSP